jgi:nucleoside-diphosphate-sugar epimerase
MKGTVLVTGAGGYIGSILVPKLIKEDYQVRAIDRFFFGEDKLEKHKNLEVVKEDTRRLKPKHFENVDYVIDLAALSNDSSGDLFKEVTFQINYLARVNAAKMAKKLGTKRYILPSSCSIYGFQENIVNETSPTNPLTTYAKANESAEKGVLLLADENFIVTVIRQSTVFGYSPRMRFDLAINGMVYGAFETGKIPLMRDGEQYRPLVHIQDTTDVMCLLLEIDQDKINGEIFNVGRNENNYQLKRLAKEIKDALPINVDIEWYGDPDRRSYQVNFDKIEKILGWKAKWSASDGTKEIFEKIKKGELDKTPETITLQWYKELIKWHEIIKNVEMYGGILKI